MEGALTSKRLGAEVVISPINGGEIVLLHIEEVLTLCNSHVYVASPYTLDPQHFSTVQIIGSHAAPEDVLAAVMAFANAPPGVAAAAAIGVSPPVTSKEEAKGL